MLGQMILCFNTLKANYQDIELSPALVQSFLFQYIEGKMKCEKFPVIVGKDVENFLNNLDKPL